ncbi:MAG: hypothetical protein B7Y26_01540 [Hydrogenophilales bacterium 16-64-46]|nr:MAG: hypothetical protein B7Z32_01240 [Hydrogenophilales bacterium 12-64-13]OYZ06516.1 MAG: hypothetical protein B7Y26_01540 [Hydrogenophilales bacterium 16-64-46]OZA39224.1 MAG: hypothetical protein B7X87_02645 [Hydrogenophilales bacterium 17-64-34]HQS98775.1 hypothetical protein [Thiobacillus sp.]
MLGLVVLAIFAGYLLVSALVVWLAARWAKKRGRRGWVWGGVAAFAMYNLVFWDWIPTVAMHKYYCATEAGFWVYKTPEQWAKENPGVLETLAPWPASKIYGDEKNSFEFKGGTVTQYNDRFGLWEKDRESLNGLLIDRQESGVLDVKTRDLLVFRINFFAGPKEAGGIWKSWLSRSTCDSDDAVRNMALIRQMADLLHMGDI